MELTQHPPNTFFWVDLGTMHVDAAQAFYAGLFAWEVHTTQIEQWTYVKFTVAGKDVAALYQMAPGQAALGYPMAWMPYVWVEDVDACTAQVKALGGKVLRGPFAVGNQGRTSAVQDPTGATFYLWQPGQHRGAQLLNQPGALAWVELATSDRLTAAAFYTRLLGWGAQTQEMAGERYTVFIQPDRRVGGMVEEHNRAPIWRVYFAVADCAATAQRAGALGGAVVIPPTPIIGMGRFAALRDPQGVGFAIIELS
jgi:uncharacterized protein